MLNVLVDVHALVMDGATDLSNVILVTDDSSLFPRLLLSSNSVVETHLFAAMDSVYTEIGKSGSGKETVCVAPASMGAVCRAKPTAHNN